MAIDRWPEAERPRERLYWNGPEALADAELLAIQLGSGMRGRSAVDVARELLAAYGSPAGGAAGGVPELAPGGRGGAAEAGDGRGTTLNPGPGQNSLSAFAL